MAETQKLTSVILSISFDQSLLTVEAGTTWDQANDPEACLMLANREVHKTEILVEILKKLTVALEEGGDGIDLAVDGRIIHKGPSFTPVAASKSIVEESRASRADPLIDLNHATTEDLQKLPGIGESLAVAIKAARPFAKVDDLREVSGVGEAKMAAIRPLVRV